MRTCLIVASLAAAPLLSYSAIALQTEKSAGLRERRIPIGKASLYSREIGRGQAIIVLHGGPDFDHGYLLPDLDRLADAFRLIYYDQRGRGRSAEQVQPEDVTLTSELEDLDAVRQHFQLPSVALLGHSWGAVLAMEYALRHPTRVSHLVLMNPAPASASDVAVFRKAYVQKLGADMGPQRQMVASAAYKEGDPEAVAARYRLHFKPALRRPEDYEKLMATMRAAFISQGKEGIVKARAVEDRLMRDTWQVDGYDLLPKVRKLATPTLVIAGAHDFIPVEVAMNIARAMPNARLVTLADCGHFAYLECADDVRKAFDDFFGRARAIGPPDFSGRWIAEPEVIAPGSPPRGSMGSGWGSPITITQDAKQLIVEHPMFSRYDLQPPLRHVYALDGSETSYPIMMSHTTQMRKSRASWKGKALEITTSYPTADPSTGERLTVEVTQRLSLESPTTLIVETTRNGAFGGRSTTARTVYQKG